VFGLYPSAIPQGPGQYSPDPEKSAYALLKEGYAWISTDFRMMVLVERLQECDSRANVPVHNYTAKSFFGARGEFPGEERNERGDYTGYERLECMSVVVRTGITSTPGEKQDAVGFSSLRVVSALNPSFARNPLTVVHLWNLQGFSYCSDVSACQRCMHISCAAVPDDVA
jgi:hypothetical protein